MGRHPSHRIAAAACALAAAAVLVAGCGDDAPVPAATSPSTATGPSTATSSGIDAGAPSEVDGFLMHKAALASASNSLQVATVGVVAGASSPAELSTALGAFRAAVDDLRTPLTDPALDRERARIVARAAAVEKAADPLVTATRADDVPALTPTGSAMLEALSALLAITGTQG